MENQTDLQPTPNEKKPFSFRKPDPKKTTLMMALTAMFMALTMAATWFLKLPVPFVADGYVNLGDAIILTCALTIGGIPASIAGGLGSMFADLLSGYGVWAPWTLIIKGLEGLIAGLLCSLIKKRVKREGLRITFCVLSMTLSALFMVFGYFVARWLVVSAAEPNAAYVALLEVPFNLAQGGIAVAIACSLIFVKKIKLMTD